jgi:hypothetical protein
MRVAVNPFMAIDNPVKLSKPTDIQGVATISDCSQPSSK